MNNMMKFLNIHRLMNQDTGTGNGGQTGAAEPKNELQNTEPDNNDSNIKIFTQEEVNEIVAKRLGKERAKIEKEIARKSYEEGLSEAEKLAKMTKEEKAQYEFNKKVADLEAKEKEFNTRELKQSALEILTDKGFNIEQSKLIATVLNYDDADKCKQSIEALEKVINKAVEIHFNAKEKTKTIPRVENKNTGEITWNDVLKDPSLLKMYQQQNK